MKETKFCSYPGCTELAEHKHYKNLCLKHGSDKRKEDFKRYRTRHPDRNCKPRKCEICGSTFVGRCEKYLCDECAKKYNLLVSKGKYRRLSIDGKKYNEHRLIAENLNLITSNRDVIHHVDMDKSNNTPEHLLVLDIKDHNSLHNYLKLELIKNPNANIRELTLNFIVDHEIHYCFCNDVP